MAKTMAAVVEVKEATVWIVKAKLDAPPPVVVPAVQLLDTDRLENVVLPPTYGEIKEACTHAWPLCTAVWLDTSSVNRRGGRAGSSMKRTEPFTAPRL